MRFLIEITTVMPLVGQVKGSFWVNAVSEVHLRSMYPNCKIIETR